MNELILPILAYVYRQWATVKPGGFLVGDDTKQREVRHVERGAEIRTANQEAAAMLATDSAQLDANRQQLDQERSELQLRTKSFEAYQRHRENKKASNATPPEVAAVLQHLSTQL